ncbi:MAG: hypothetical protein AUJ72_05845 [Candidatus Omnitrophica bacterium CG1_02_46_14]|nr:MAG: hypothetical protein AUJ72_05845 [Candidatus Omnitrophica bacterium CG1_02_46_14]
MILKNCLRELLIKFKILPSQCTWLNPFKIIEFEELMKNANWSKNDAVLDLGCGGGRQTVLIAKRVRKIVGIDIDNVEIERAADYSRAYSMDLNTEFRCVSLENANFKQCEFDKIVSVCVLEHIPGYQEILRRIFKLLKDEGVLLMSVDSLATIEDPGLIARHAAIGKVVHLFTQNEMLSLLTNVGFCDIEVRPIFRSRFAKELFQKDIENSFPGHERFVTLCDYWLLRIHEFFSRNFDKGIFLCVKATKKAP